MATGEAIAEGICERIGLKNSSMVYKSQGKKEKISCDMPTHKEAIDIVLKTLQDLKIGVVKSIDEIDAVGHRVVHGGEKFDKAVLVDRDVLNSIEELSSLGPLHNPANLLGIEVCMELMPGKPNVAVFDTAFHQTMGEEAFMYALPHEDYSELKVRKYGFHGTSHKYIAKVASVSAVRGGKCVDTSMGLTPLQGLMMGTRCGELDPSAVLYIMGKRGLSASEMDIRMNKQSGFLRIFGESSDCRDIEDGIKAGNQKAILAYDMFCHKVKHYVEAYAAIMGGVDAGIGENGPEIREAVCKGLEFLGVEFDREKNVQRKSGIQLLSTESSKVRVYKIPTNEEYMIAEDAYRPVK